MAAILLFLCGLGGLGSDNYQQRYKAQEHLNKYPYLKYLGYNSRVLEIRYRCRSTPCSLDMFGNIYYSYERFLCKLEDPDFVFDVAGNGNRIGMLPQKYDVPFIVDMATQVGAMRGIHRRCTIHNFITYAMELKQVRIDRDKLRNKKKGTSP